MVPARPFFIGSPGWVRSSAWIWLFSSTERTMAWSGGLTYSPTISLSLAANCGSLDSLNRRTRCGRRPGARQIRCTELTLFPAAFAIAEPVQWLAVGGGPRSLVHSSDSHTRVRQGIPERIELSDLVH